MVVVSTAAFHARVRGSVPGTGGLKEIKMFLPHPPVKLRFVRSLRDREGACSASDRQGTNFESCVWRTVSSHSSLHPQEALLAQFSLYLHKGDLKPDSFHFYIKMNDYYIEWSDRLGFWKWAKWYKCGHFSNNLCWVFESVINLIRVEILVVSYCLTWLFCSDLNHILIW